MARRDITVTITARDLASNVFAQARGEVLKYAAGFASGQVAIDAFYRAIDIGKRIIVDSINAYAEAEQVTARLSASFKALGVDQVSATLSASDLATKLSQQSSFSDEAIQSAQELLVSIGKLSGEGLDRATRASVDLATKLKIDVTDAAKLLAKAAVGATETLARYGIVVDKTGTDSEVFARVLQQVETQFGGIARAASETLAGSMDQVTKSVDELKESFGELLAQRGVSELISGTTGALRELRTALDDNSSSVSEFVSLLQSVGVGVNPLGNWFKVASDSMKALDNGEKIMQPLIDALNQLSSGSTVDTGPFKAFFASVEEGTKALEKQRKAAEEANTFLKKYMETVQFNARIGLSFLSIPFPEDKTKIPLDAGTLFDAGVIGGPSNNDRGIVFGEGGDSSRFDPDTSSIADAGDRFDAAIKSASESMMTIEDAGRELAYGIFATLSTNVYALFTGAQSFGETIRAIFADILQMVIKIVIQLAVATALKAAFGVALVNSGGVIHAAAGMVGGPDVSADVVPALLTPGEVVLSRSEAERYMSAPQKSGATGAGQINASVVMPSKMFREWVRYQKDWVRRRGGTLATQGSF